MKVFSEPGVLSRSERFFSTPSATARRLFYYVTRVGHYYYDARYNFLDSCDIAHLESHKNLFLTYVRSGTMYFETDQLYCAERGQIGLVDCRRPHHFYTKGDAEALWIHFDGANAAAFFEQILAFRGGRQVLTPPADLRIEQELAQIISGLRTGDMTEAGPLAAHLPNSVRAAVSGAGGTRPEKRCHCTGGQVYRRTPV